MKKMTNAEFQAEDLIKSFDFSIPINPVDVCSAISSGSSIIEYHEREFETENICGLTVCNSKNIQIIVNTKIINPTRRLFTAAHEIGHVVLHILTGKNHETKCSKKDIRINEGTELEAEANQFASALLMPSSLIKNKIIRSDLTWKLIEEISKSYKTSLEATARRVISLTKDTCALIIHDNSQMWTPIKSNSFNYFLRPTCFPKYLSTKDYRANGDAPHKLTKCDLSDWDINLDSNTHHCWYSSLSFKSDNYNRIMTILSIEEIDYDDRDF